MGSEHKQEHGHKKRRLGIMDDDEDEDEYIDIDDIRLNEDDDDVSSKLADGWYDEDSSQWSILSEAETEFESEWKDDALWDEISNIETSAGRKVTRKCMIYLAESCACASF